MTHLKAIQEAHKRIKPYIRRTPLYLSEYYSPYENEVYFKYESLQKTGSFKLRGALNKVLVYAEKHRIDLSEGGYKLVTISGGNHGLAVAAVGQIFGLGTTVIYPTTVPGERVKKMQSRGCVTVDGGASWDTIMDTLEPFLKDPRTIFIHPFNDMDVIYGQGTVALEMLEDNPELDIIMCSIGGGGLISGTSYAAKDISPEIKIYGVETEGAHSMSVSLANDEITALPKITSVAASLGAAKVGEIGFEAVKKNVEEVFTVSDEESLNDLEELLSLEKVLVEPATSCVISALKQFGESRGIVGKKVGIILCGSNYEVKI
jgi:threonine dehydratase